MNVGCVAVLLAANHKGTLGSGRKRVHLIGQLDLVLAAERNLLDASQVNQFRKAGIKSGICAKGLNITFDVAEPELFCKPHPDQSARSIDRIRRAGWIKNESAIGPFPDY